MDTEYPLPDTTDQVRCRWPSEASSSCSPRDWPKVGKVRSTWPLLLEPSSPKRTTVDDTPVKVADTFKECRFEPICVERDPPERDHVLRRSKSFATCPSRVRNTVRERLTDCANEFERLQEENLRLAKEIRALRLKGSGSSVSLRSSQPKLVTLDVGVPSRRERGAGTGQSATHLRTLVLDRPRTQSFTGVLPGQAASECDPSEVEVASEATEDFWVCGVETCDCQSKPETGHPQLIRSDSRHSLTRNNEERGINVNGELSYAVQGNTRLSSNGQIVSDSSVTFSPMPLQVGKSLSEVTEVVEVNVLPDYFNPQAVQRASSSQLFRQIEDPVPPPDPCVFSPLGNFRVFWDFLLFLCLAYEFWEMPFELVFLQNVEVPVVLEVLLHIVTAVYFVDILLNFTTGYLEGNKTVMQRSRIVRKYFSWWFWFDALAAIPFDYLLPGLSNARAANVNQLMRLGKVPKILKTFRYLRVLHCVRHRVQICELMLSGQVHLRWLVKLGWLALAVLHLLTLAHIQGCIWASLCHEELLSEGGTIDEAWHVYFQSFCWAYLALTTGLAPSVSPVQTSSPSLWVLEVAISTQRLVLLGVLAVYGIFQATISIGQRAQWAMQKEDMLKHLRRHKVSSETQLQVLCCMQETREATTRQKHFNAMLKDFPGELQRDICVEMWSCPLLSLGLIMHIAHWHEELLAELAMIITEETLASKSVVCHAGEASTEAYHVVRGALTVLVAGDAKVIPDFTTGMWVGEKALVNPMLKRSATVVTRNVSTLMVVPGNRFHELLVRLNIYDRFEQFCEDHIWRGLCGRCGILGEHFSHNCPVMVSAEPRGGLSPFRRLWGSRQDPTNQLIGLRREWHSRMSELVEEGNDRELKTFLQKHRLDRLGPVLDDLGVKSIQELKDTNLRTLRVHLEFQAEGHGLTQAELKALTPESIALFERSIRSASSSAVRQKVHDHHLMFLSHYKVEAGTEAALIRAELEHIMSLDPTSPARHFDVPVFLDSEDLVDLAALRERVNRSHNLVLLLTEGVLLRPWVLVELVTAVQLGAQVLLVEVSKPGNVFAFPDEEFFIKLLKGDLLKEKDMAVLQDCGVRLAEVESALRKVFKRIAVPYSPHRQQSIRHAELRTLLAMVKIRDSSGASSSRPSVYT